MSSGTRQDVLTQDFDWSWTRTDTEWVPPAIDPTRVNAARIYNYFLDGKDHFEVDRAAAREILKVAPHARRTAQANRGFLRRAIRHVIRDHGIRQVIDLGTGIPTSPNVHEIARDEAPNVRVLYLDNDPVVMAHNRAILATEPGIVTLLRDLREPHTVLDDPAVRRFIDFDQPVGLFFVAVLHFVAVEQTSALLARYRDAVAPGSVIVVSTLCRDHLDEATLRVAERAYRNSESTLHARSVAQVEQLFEGFRLEAPLTSVSEWDTGSETRSPLPASFVPVSRALMAGVGIKEYRLAGLARR
jgi:O-methyltransferase involved in polyketide biosynthesis